MNNVSLYLSKSENVHTGGDIELTGAYISLLKPFQIEGVRFLFWQYIKGKGAILNDESGLGKTIQTILCLSAIQLLIPLTAIILCREEEVEHWRSHIRNWSRSTAFAPGEDISGDRLAVASVEQFAAALGQSWDVVVVDDLDAADTTEQLSRLKFKFKIWLASSNLMADPVSLFYIVHWLYPNSVGSRPDFLKQFSLADVSVLEAWKRRQGLHILCNQFYLRRIKNNLKTQLTDEIKCMENKNKPNNSTILTSNTLYFVDEKKSDDSVELMDTFNDDDPNDNDCSPSILDFSVRPVTRNTPKDDHLPKTKGTKDETGLMIKRSSSKGINFIEDNHLREKTRINSSGWACMPSAPNSTSF